MGKLEIIKLPVSSNFCLIAQGWTDKRDALKLTKWPGDGMEVDFVARSWYIVFVHYLAQCVRLTASLPA